MARIIYVLYLLVLISGVRCPISPNWLNGPSYENVDLEVMQQSKHHVSLRDRRATKKDYIINEAAKRGHFCGGSLISKTVVVTAAFCLFSQTESGPETYHARHILVVLGGTKLHETTINTLRFEVRRLIPHPKYSKFTTENDIGLVILDVEVPMLHQSVHPIPLASKRPEVDVTCKIFGWGVNYIENPFDHNQYQAYVQNDLKITNLTTLDNEFCELAASVNGTEVFSIAGKFCAGTTRNPFNATCKADIGSGVAIAGVLYGIVLYNPHCGSSLFQTSYGLYTDISQFKHWILSKGFINNNLSRAYLFFILLFSYFVRNCLWWKL